MKINYVFGHLKRYAVRYNVADVLQPCTHQYTYLLGTKLLCRMPVLSLPGDLSEQLKASESGTINNTVGPGVAVYWALDRSARADIYIGLELDGFKRYQNISSVHPRIKMQFAVQPVVLCQTDLLNFNPNHDHVIGMQVVVSLPCSALITDDVVVKYSSGWL